MSNQQDPAPWLPPWYEPLEVMADGTRLTREHAWANSHGMDGLYERIAQHHGYMDSIDVIEVGSWAGGGALRMLHKLQEFELDVSIFCVDTWAGTPPERGDTTTIISQAIGPDNVFRTFLKNVREKLFGWITPCRGTSLFWASVWAKPVDCVFIDADHSYEAVRKDLRAWWPHVRSGGLFAGHDYHMFEGVKRAVDEWAAEVGLPVEVDGECWFVRKP